MSLIYNVLNAASFERWNAVNTGRMK